VHRRINLHTEPSASKILRDKDSAYCFVYYVSRSRQMGTQSPPQKGGGAPQFSAHVYCGKKAGWIKMALAMEVDLCPGHIVLDVGRGPSFRERDSPLVSAHVHCGHCRPSQLLLLSFMQRSNNC